jgi:hypothetical protein
MEAMASQFKRIAGDRYAKNPTINTPQNNAPRPTRTISEALRERGSINVAPDMQF